MTTPATGRPSGFAVRPARAADLAAARALMRRVFEEDFGYGYTAMCLHTGASAPGAEAFWRSVGKLVHDGRAETPPPAVYFAVALASGGVGQDG